MEQNKKKTRLKRYRLTYPFSGNKIYESKSFEKAIKGCYKEFRQLSDITEGMFMVTELGSKTTFQFQINDKKIEQVNKSNRSRKSNKSNNEQFGGLSSDINIATINNSICESNISDISNVIKVKQYGGNSDITSVQNIKKEILQLEKQIENNNKIIQLELDTSAQKSIQLQLQNRVDEIDSIADVNYDNKNNNDINAATTSPALSEIKYPNSISSTQPIIKADQNSIIMESINKLNERINILENANKKLDDIEIIASEDSELDKPKATLKLPIETDEEISYTEVQNIKPTTNIKLTPDDIYKSNLKKLEAYNSKDELGKSGSSCQIM